MWTVLLYKLCMLSFGHKGSVPVRHFRRCLSISGDTFSPAFFLTPSHPSVRNLSTSQPVCMCCYYYILSIITMFNIICGHCQEFQRFVSVGWIICMWHVDYLKFWLVRQAWSHLFYTALFLRWWYWQDDTSKAMTSLLKWCVNDEDSDGDSCNCCSQLSLQLPLIASH